MEERDAYLSAAVPVMVMVSTDSAASTVYSVISGEKAGTRVPVLTDSPERSALVDLCLTLTVYLLIFPSFAVTTRTIAALPEARDCGTPLLSDITAFGSETSPVTVTAPVDSGNGDRIFRNLRRKVRRQSSFTYRNGRQVGIRGFRTIRRGTAC